MLEDIVVLLVSLDLLAPAFVILSFFTPKGSPVNQRTPNVIVGQTEFVDSSLGHVVGLHGAAMLTTERIVSCD